jgi:glycosyltransferase involved in cell wall biosynthesis
MKILQITPYFLPHTGGIERYVYNLSKNLVKMGHEVEIIASNVPQNKETEQLDGITIRRYHCLCEPLRTPIVPDLLKLGDTLDQFDIINIHNAYSFGAVCAAHFSRTCATPIVLTHHGQHRFGEPLKDFCVQLYRNSAERFILRSVDHIVVLSQSDALYVSSLGADQNNINIIPNAINVDDFSSYTSLDPTEFLEKHNLEGKKIILYVGEVIARKGIEYLIKSVPSVTAGIHLEEEVVLVIVGAGDYLSSAKTLVKELKLEKSVIFLGRVSFTELLQAYRSADLFVLPSLSEGLPTSILEAMYFGLPVVSTDIPGVRDHFKGIALLVPPRNEHALSDALCTLLSDNGVSQDLSHRSKTLIKTGYTWDLVVKQYERMYANLTE